MTFTLADETVRSAADISECGQYRYTLSRVWDDDLPLVGYCMLNPSTADAMQDDPTIRKCIHFARAHGYGGIRVVNLFAFRSAHPAELPVLVGQAQGPANETHLRRLASHVASVICAWGCNVRVTPEVVGVAMRAFAGTDLPTLCLGRTKDGSPRHPLYLANSTSLETYP